MKELSVWESVARSYATFGSPFVPCREDTALAEAAVSAWAAGRQGERIEALLLGVTPAIALMSWPPRTFVTGVDRSDAVVRAIWPGDIPDKRRAIVATWSEHLREEKSCDVIIGDGVFNTCSFPEGLESLLSLVDATLKDDGLLVVRCYVRPDVQETVQDVFDALLGHGGLKVDCFKMRLFLAMQRSAADGVDLREAHAILGRFGVDEQVMAEKLTWPAGSIAPFAAWRKSGGTYAFPTIEQFHSLLSARFAVTSTLFPTYELGHVCPTLVMRSRERRSR